MAAAVDHCCKLWEKSGKAELIKLCRNQPESNLQLGTVSRVIKRSFYEVCWQVIKGNVKLETAVHALGEVCDYVKDAAPHLADVFSLIDLECLAQDDKDLRDKLVDIIAACESSVTIAVLKERLDQELLENVGLIPSKLAFQKTYVKIKTKLYYKQQKFNLLREESEGYAKLITELNQDITDSLSPSQCVQNLKSLIGCFDLDPNRVIDILLESFECRPHLGSFYIPIFKEYVTDRTTLCQILGFKFHFYQEEETPDSLYKIAAVLLNNDLVDLDTLYPHLSPTDDKVKEYNQKEIDEAKSYARKLNVVSLADKTDDPKDSENVKVDLYATNQKIGLCEALLNLGAWKNAKDILDRLPEFFAMVHKPIATAMCLLIHYLIDPLYRENTVIPKRVLKGRLSSKHKYDSDVNKVHTYRDLHGEVFPIMRYLGPYSACDPVLLVKIIRLGKSFMLKRHSGGISAEDEVAYYGILNMLDEVLLPSMAFLPCNCCISEELWGLLKLFPYELRYRLYGNWKNDTYSHHPKLIRIRADCLERARYLMKRLSKENVKPSGRQLGKLSHSNPGVLFEYTLSQIQRYDNFIGPVVDTLKFLTSLSYDVLAYCIIEAVANPEKDRMKHDDTNISLWLQSLANFAGSICRKYQVELAGLLQYVANQLKAGKSYDLLILREIVTKMAGIEISEEITNDQLEAMTGGELLRQEGGYFAQVRNTKKSSTRLKDTLLEHNLALSLCLLMAQQRDGVIYHEGSESHLKLVGKLYDQCQDTLVQFGSFLSMQLSTEEFVKRLPSIDTLMSSYHIPADSAFFLSRPQYAYAISSRFEELRKIDKSNKQGGSQLKLQRFIEASEEMMQPVIELIRPLYSSRVWEDLSPQFYVTFWSLQMYDLFVPTSVYEKQIQQLQAQASAAEDNKDLTQGKRKKEKERCHNLIEKLRDEMKKQGEHCNRVINRLKAQKEQWFISRSTKNETITQFLQLCVFPRCCFTAADAVFCAKFIHVLHDLKTPNFSTLICCDRIFCDITYTVTSCTENEAHRYGRFLCSALDTIMRWHSNKDIYDKECGSYPGFVTVFRKGIETQPAQQIKADQLDYENYRHVCHKWHFRITKAMVACLESGNYIQIRNALIVLTKILPNYPKITQFGQALERRVDRLRQEEKEKRPDIYALAMGYSGQLKSKKTSWVQEHQFHYKEGKGVVTKATSTVPNGPVAGPSASQSAARSDGASAQASASSSKKSSSDTKVSKKTDGETKTKEKKEKKSSDKKDKSKSDKKGADGDKKDLVNGTKTKEKKEKRDKEDKKEKSHSAEKSSTDKSQTEEKNSHDKGQEGSKDKESLKVKESSKVKERKEKHEGKQSEVKIKVKEEKDKWEEPSTSDGKTPDAKARHKEETHNSEAKSERREIKIERHQETKEDRKSEKEVKVKEEKQEKEGKSKEDRHGKIKRSYSPERDTSERDSGKGHQREHGESSDSRILHHHRSPEPSSSKQSDEREVKRRKLEGQASGSKERERSESKERHHKSPSHERERKDRKRMSMDLDDRNDDAKRRRSAEPSSSHSHTSTGSMNGETDRRHSKKDGEKSSRHDKDSTRQDREDRGSSRDKLIRDGTDSAESSPQHKAKEHKERDKDKSRSREKKDKSSSKKSKK